MVRVLQQLRDIQAGKDPLVAYQLHGRINTLLGAFSHDHKVGAEKLANLLEEWETSIRENEKE